MPTSPQKPPSAPQEARQAPAVGGAAPGQPPAPLQCVSVLLVTLSGRVLLCERKRQPGRWSPPGGKVDPGETPLQAALRETREEAGLELAPGSLQEVYGRPWPAGEDHGHAAGFTRVFRYVGDASHLGERVSPGPGEGQAGWFALSALADPKVSAFPLFYAGVLQACGDQLLPGEFGILEATTAVNRLPARIKALREYRGLTQREACARVHLAIGTWATIECSGANPSALVLVRVAAALQVRLDVLFSDGPVDLELRREQAFARMNNDLHQQLAELGDL